MKSFALTMLLLAALCAAAASSLQAQNSAVRAMLNQVSADSLMSYDAVLERASGTYSRVSYTPGNDSSVQYILRTLRRYPAITRAELDTFFVPEAPAPYSTQPLFNVFGIIKGTKDTLTAVVIGAHLDTYAGRESTWISQWRTIHAPGADDNGTGVSNMLESARIFAGASAAGYTNDYTLIFAAFNAEEAGVPNVTYPVYLYGSQHFAARLKAEGYHVRAMINVDMIGFNTKLTADVVSDNNSQAIGATAVAVNAQYGLGLAMNAPPFVFATYSDHSSFWNQGDPAVLLIEHAPPNVTTSDYTINTLYHTSHDTVGALNPELFKRSVQLAIGTAANFAVQTLPNSVTTIEAKAPAGFALEQNYPNPFNPSTTLRFSIAEPRFVQLTIADVLGREIAVLVRQSMQPGTYSVAWNAGALPSGMYVAVLRATQAQGGGGAGQVFLETRKLLLQK
jgi:hypothetical protein